MHRMTSDDLGHLTVKPTLCTLSTCPRGPSLGPFHSNTSRVLRHSAVENRKCIK